MVIGIHVSSTKESVGRATCTLAGTRQKRIELSAIRLRKSSSRLTTKTSTTKSLAPARCSTPLIRSSCVSSQSASCALSREEIQKLRRLQSVSGCRRENLTEFEQHQQSRCDFKFITNLAVSTGVRFSDYFLAQETQRCQNAVSSFEAQIPTGGSVSLESQRVLQRIWVFS